MGSILAKWAGACAFTALAEGCSDGTNVTPAGPATGGLGGVAGNPMGRASAGGTAGVPGAGGAAGLGAGGMPGGGAPGSGGMISARARSKKWWTVACAA